MPISSSAKPKIEATIYKFKKEVLPKRAAQF